MYIFQEYANRFGIKEQFIRQHDAVVFIKGQSDIILSAKRIYFDNQPSKFRVELFYSNKPKDFFDLDIEQYEDYVNLNLKSKKNSILDYFEIYFFCWNFFLVHNDFILEKNISPNLIYPTIDDSICKEKRIDYIGQLSYLLQVEFPKLYVNWNYFRQNIDNYSYWLAEIINS